MNIIASIGMGFFEIIILVPLLALFPFWIWMIVDCVKKEPSQGKRIAWIIVMGVFLGPFGAVLYFLFCKLPRRLTRTDKDGNGVALFLGLAAALIVGPVFLAVVIPTVGAIRGNLSKANVDHSSGLTVEESELIVKRRWPEITSEPHASTIRELVKIRWESNPDFFDKSDWPIRLAEEYSKAVGLDEAKSN